MADELSLFGFTIKRKKPAVENSVITPIPDDGSTVVNNAAAYYGLVVDIEGQIKNENDLIRRYRESAQYADCDAAIEEIVNEAIVSDPSEPIASVNLDKTKLSDSIKTKISDEFEEILKLLKFDDKAHDVFRQWYIDGRLYYHIILSESAKDGIYELRYVDPRKIRKIKKITKDKNAQGVDVVKNIEEYYLYNDRGINEQTSQGVKLSPDSVICITSGLQDANTTMMLGHLHKAIKPVNQLKMMEDALVIYRISRAPERRIFYIDVGNLPKAKAEQYVTDIMNKFRNKIVYDATTGEVKDGRQHLCLSMDTKVPLLDGRTLSLTEITEEYNSGKKLWAYSCDPNTGKFVPGPITWAGVTRKNAEIMRLTLDNEKTITCTPEHKFPVWNKGLIRADQLVEGESMIPHYTKKSKVNNATTSEYEQIYKNDTNNWEFTHRLVSRWKDLEEIPNESCFSETYKEEIKTTVHHYDFNPRNNNPENLMRMHRYDHIYMHGVMSTNGGKIGGQSTKDQGKGFFNKNHPEYHNWHVNAGMAGGKKSSETGKSKQNWIIGQEILAEKMKDPVWNAWFRNKQRLGWTEDKKQTASDHAKNNNLNARGNLAQIELWKTEEHKMKWRSMYKVEYNDEMFYIINDCVNRKLNIKDTLEIMNNSDVLLKWQEINSNKVLNRNQKTFDYFIDADINRIISQFSDVKTFTQLKNKCEFRNHKIIKIEYLENREDTGCLTIDGEEIYHNYHTFALDAGIYTENSLMEDFWMPRREGGKGTEITTLQGGQSLGQIEDIQYFQKKLYQSLNVPIQRLDNQNPFNSGRSNEITREEIKFNKFINRLRLRFCQLFKEALRVQLIVKNIIKPEEWDDIEYNIRFDFQEDNNFAELKDAELINNRIATLQNMDPYVGKYYSMAWVRKNLLYQTEKDIKEIDKEIKQEQPLLDALTSDKETQE